MSQVASWTQALGPDILAQTVCTPILADVRAVRFVCGWERDPSVLWVGPGEDILELLRTQNDLSGSTFLAAGNADGLIACAQSRSANLVVTSLELIRLHEAASAVLRRYQEWAVLLLKAAGARRGLQDILDTAAHLAGGALFLLGADGRTAYSGVCPQMDISLARRLLQSGCLPPDTLPLEPGEGPGGMARLPLEDGICWVKPSQGADGSAAHMLLFTPSGWTLPDAAELLHLVWRTVEQLPLEEKGGYWSRTDLKQFLADLLAKRLTQEDEIGRQLSRLLCGAAAPAGDGFPRQHRGAVWQRGSAAGQLPRPGLPAQPFLRPGASPGAAGPVRPVCRRQQRHQPPGHAAHHLSAHQKRHAAGPSPTFQLQDPDLPF